MRNPQTHVIRKLPRAGGFTLVEVCLALGIIGAAFIPLLGLLSVGFSTMKESNLDVKTSLIAQKILAAAQMVPYGTLSASTKYLDFDGNEVAAANSVFQAQVAAAPDNLLGSANLKTVTVTLTGSGVQGRPRVFAASVANIGD